MKMKMTLEATLKPGFDTAFDRLCNDNAVGVKDRYALARTRRDIGSHLDTYAEQRVRLFQEHGEPEQEVLKRRIEQGKGDAAKQQARLEALEKSKAESWAIDPDDAEALKAVEEKLKELRSVEFEIYLDHKVALPEGCSLTAAEIEALLDIIEEPK